MTPASSRRRNRSATAGDDSPTRRPSSASVRRASRCSSASSRRSVRSSEAPSAIMPSRLRTVAMPATLPPITPVREATHRPRCRPMEQHAAALGAHRPLERTPPHLYFVGSAVFHYLGPAFAVLLFARVDVLGVAWLRIASAALVFALWRRPWRTIAGA